MSLNKHIILLIALTSSLSVFSQDCPIQKSYFKGGEKISYQVYYHWGLVWASAGEASFSVEKKLFGNRIPSYHLVGEGKSLPKWDWMYKVRDRYESFVDTNTLFPIYFKRNVEEGSTKLTEEYVFNKRNKSIYTTQKKLNEKEVKDTLRFMTCLYDAVSLVYYARCIDFSKYKKGDKIPLTLVVDNGIYDIFLRYHGKEVLELKNGKKYNTQKFSALLVEGTIFKGGEGMNVWVTDDNNRMPIKISSEILVGNIEVYLQNFEGLKHPVSSEIVTK